MNKKSKKWLTCYFFTKKRNKTTGHATGHTKTNKTKQQYKLINNIITKLDN